MIIALLTACGEKPVTHARVDSSITAVRGMGVRGGGELVAVFNAVEDGARVVRTGSESPASSLGNTGFRFVLNSFGTTDNSARGFQFFGPIGVGFAGSPAGYL